MQLKITFTSDRAYLASWQDRIIARYELLKTKSAARLKAVYLGVRSMPEAQELAKKLNQLFSCKVEIRTAQRCDTAFEVVIRSPRVSLMPEIERFIKELITAAVKGDAAKIVPFPVAPSQPAPIAMGSGASLRLRERMSRDHRGRTLVGGLSID
jgi:hypothetical protein